MLKKRLRRPPGGSGSGFLRVLKTHRNIEASWDRFSVDFGRILGTTREAKIVFSLKRESNFDIFGHLKLRCFLDPQKARFWLHLGGARGTGNGHVGLEEASRTELKLLFKGFYWASFWRAKKRRRARTRVPGKPSRPSKPSRPGGGSLKES